MALKKQAIAYWLKIKQLPRKYTIPSAVILGLLLVYSLIFFINKPVTFSYAEKTCVRQLTLFPDVHRTASGNENYSIELGKPLKIGNWSALTMSACFTPNKAPQEGSFKVSSAPFGGFLFRKNFVIKVGPPPIMSTAILDKPLPTFKPLKLPLSDTDKVFSYAVKANKSKVTCKPETKAALCEVKELKLAQGAPYEVEIIREFNKTHIASVVKKEVQTLPAAHIVDSSIKPGENVFSRPKTINLVFDKKITKIDPVLHKMEGEKRTRIPIKTTVKDKIIQIAIDEDLPRSMDYILEANKVEADDGSGLEEPYKLAFKTSGGPKVVGVNIGSSGVAMGTTVVVAFDQALSDKQDISKIITATGGAAVAARKGNQVHVSLAGVPKCGVFSIKITNDLLSSYDISGNTAWSFNSKVVCYTVSTIGYSKRGRAINAYYYGNGGSTVLYTGAIHGNEYSSSYILKDWMNELDAKAGDIPAGRQIVVVPTLNPDGVAAGSRNNSRNVNLNRNFDVSDWKSDINDTNGTVKGGGGSEPMSEPETKAIANLSRQLRPRLVLSYHAVGSVAIGNQAGDSARLASQYASMVGYRNGTGSSSEVFDYEITGTYDDWLAEKMGIPSMVIELGSYSFRDFGHHRAAFWTMAKS